MSYLKDVLKKETFSDSLLKRKMLLKRKIPSLTAKLVYFV